MKNLFKLLSKLLRTQQKQQSFIDYMKQVENAGKVGYKRGIWSPHKSPEGGADTIAYGHKIQKGEDFSEGITDMEAERLLAKDIQKARRIVRTNYLKGKTEK